jgi:hypothetical protein
VTPGPARIAAERVVAAEPPDVFAFLADLENHWLLADRFVDVLSLERSPGDGRAHGGAVRLRGPLGLGRTVTTRLVDTRPHSSIAGTATVGRRTRADVDWRLSPVPGGTLVLLEATVRRATGIDSLLLAAGGRRWLEERFASILERLGRRLGPDPGQRSSA